MFVILGLVLLVLIGIIMYLSLEKQPKAEQVPFEQERISLFITGCLDQALKSGITYCASGNQCPYYEEDLGGQVVTSFLECTGARGERIQEQFPNYGIETGNVDIIIERKEYKTEASLSFPVIIRRGTTEHKLDNFKSEYIFKSAGCIPCPTCDDNCITQDTLEVSILDLSWTIPPGGFVGLKEGECLAC